MMNAPAGQFRPDSVFGLDGTALGQLMPMHLRLNAGGIVCGAGPTLARITGDAPIGRPFSEVVTLRRPRAAIDMEGLLGLRGKALKATLAAAPTLPLKGLVVGLPGDEGAVLNLSLGISLIDAVGQFDLTLGDFAPTDLAVELLYLSEAKSAVAGELRRMAHRLNGARVTAEEEAATDTLTGLANRRRLDAMLQTFLAEQRDFSVMHVDLDFFKQVNDSYGHGVGDAVLRIVGRVIGAQFRRRDIVARVGGDEFVVLVADIVDPVRLDRLARRVIDRLEQPITVRDVTCRISASIGIAPSTRLDRRDAAELLHAADVALYASKRKGRRQTTIATEDALNARGRASDPR